MTQTLSDFKDYVTLYPAPRPPLDRLGHYPQEPEAPARGLLVGAILGGCCWLALAGIALAARRWAL